MKLVSCIFNKCGSNSASNTWSLQCNFSIAETMVCLPFIYALEVCVIFNSPLHQLCDDGGYCNLSMRSFRRMPPSPRGNFNKGKHHDIDDWQSLVLIFFLGHILRHRSVEVQPSVLHGLPLVTELDKWSSVSAIGEYHVGRMYGLGGQAVGE